MTGNFNIATNYSLQADNTAPAYDAEVVVPSDTVDFTKGFCRSIYVGGAGTISVAMASGVVVQHIGVLAGSVLPVCASRVMLTGTTATSMVAWF